MIPGLPKDIICYLFGLSPMPLCARNTAECGDVFPTSPLQLEVGPQDQGGPMVPRALKMQHRRPDPPLKAGELDFDVPLLPTS